MRLVTHLALYIFAVSREVGLSFVLYVFRLLLPQKKFNQESFFFVVVLLVSARTTTRDRVRWREAALPSQLIINEHYNN